MTEQVKQDSNFTELRYAVEESPGVLPTTPEWIPVEPNEYKDFGGTVTTKARNPINASRQRKKGVVVDLEAMAGFVQDITATNTQGFMSSFLFAAPREKTSLAVATVDGMNNDYEPASGGAAFQAGDLLLAEDFDEAVNNGLKLVSGVPVAASVPVTDTGLVAETGASGTIKRVGFQFATGIASIDADGTATFPKLNVANVAASAVLDITGDSIADQDTVVVGGVTYTFEAGALAASTSTDVDVNLGMDDDESRANLVAAINLSGTQGVEYGTGTTANPLVTADDGVADQVKFTAKLTGAASNGLGALSTDISGATIDATLSGGVGRDLTTLGIIPGEFVYLGDDAADTSFATDEDNGFCRVRSVSANQIIFDKTQFPMEDDNGAGKTIRLVLGTVLKNEVEKALIVTRPLQFERSLGAPDDAQPTDIQGEYVTRCIADEAKLDFKTADISRLEATFVGGTHETRTGDQGLKDGTRPELTESDAFNTTSDVSLIKMALVTDGDSCPAPLFAYLTDLAVSIKNNTKQNKAISVLGSFSVTAGTFEVSAEVTAYFQTVTAIAQVQNNASVTLEQHMVKANKGITFDLPLVTLSKAMAEVKQDEPVMLPLSSDAATAKFIHPTLDYTLLMVYWPYLPDVAG